MAARLPPSTGKHPEYAASRRFEILTRSESESATKPVNIHEAKTHVSRLVERAATGSEIAGKVALRTLDVLPDARSWLPDALAASGLAVLPVSLEHALGVERLPRTRATRSTAS